MRNKRAIRNRGLRRKKEVLDLDITSLLDILVILLVFLLKSYNSSGVVLNVPKEVTLPKSESQINNTSGIIVQISKDKIWVDDKEIADIKTSRYDRGGKRIVPLFNELVRKKDIVKQIQKTTPNADRFSGIVNLVIDKTHKYSFIKKVLYTSAEAGFKQYKFVVMGQE